MSEDVPAAIRNEYPNARASAVAVGADPATMEYLGAGAEGILFVDGNVVYKVGRYKPLVYEAEALEALSAAGAPVPAFYGYDAGHNTIIREHIEGRPGGWGARGLRDVYEREIQPALREAGFACGEYKENSFIVREDTGEPVMVDLGFLCPIGARFVRDMGEKMKQLSPRDNWFDLQSEIRIALSYGDITPEQAAEWADMLADMFGENRVSDLRSLIRSETRTANPSKKKGITRKQFGDEFAALAHRAGLKDVCAIEFTSEVRISPRSYADVDPRELHFRFAPETLELPAAHRRGLIMHEIGHVLCRELPDGGTEDDADKAAYAAFGERITYDHNWPGKGLQCVGEDRKHNPPRREWQSVDGRRWVESILNTPRGERAVIRTEGRNYTELLDPAELDGLIDFEERQKEDRRCMQLRAKEHDERERIASLPAVSIAAYTAKMTKLQATRVRAALEKQQGFSGEFLKRYEFIERAVLDGWMVEQGRTGRELTSSQGRYYTERDITKTAMDFAEFLIRSKIV
jgi:hypothetical protein